MGDSLILSLRDTCCGEIWTASSSLNAAPLELEEKELLELLDCDELVCLKPFVDFWSLRDSTIVYLLSGLLM